MCHEFWRYEEMHAADDAAKRRAQEIIDKAKSAQPASPPASPATSEMEKETVPV